MKNTREHPTEPAVVKQCPSRLGRPSPVTGNRYREALLFRTVKRIWRKAKLIRVAPRK